MRLQLHVIKNEVNFQNARLEDSSESSEEGYPKLENDFENFFTSCVRGRVRVRVRVCMCMYMYMQACMQNFRIANSL